MWEKNRFGSANEPGRCWDRIPARGFLQTCHGNYRISRLHQDVSLPVLSYHQCCVVLDSASGMENPHCNMRQKWAVLESCQLYRW